MPYYSEVQQKYIEERNTSFNDKKSLFTQKNKNMFYQLIKYLYNNHKDTSAEKSAGTFCVTTGKNRYVFPSPELNSDKDNSPFSEAVNDEDTYKQLVYTLNSVLIEIAESNINGQDINETDANIDFEKLEGVKGRKSKGNKSLKKRKARFNKSVISPGLKSQMTEKGPHRLRLLLYAYALKMSAAETKELMQTIDPNLPVNIWNGYEVIVFYAINRKQHDITLNDLDYLGQVMSIEDAEVETAFLDNCTTDTDVALDFFNSLAETDKEASIKEMEKLLRNIKVSGKISSIKAKEELDSMFRYVIEKGDRIFKGDYWEKYYCKDNNTEVDFRKCRDAITEQFWPYYENQVQFRSRIENEHYINLQEMRSLPTKKHLKAVDEKKQAVTRADLEFSFFLKFALDNHISKYVRSDIAVGTDELITQRFHDYKSQADVLLTKYHFEKTGAKYRFDDMLMVCMQKEYPVKELHAIAADYFLIARDDVEIHDI